ncbi:MAG: acyl-CoA dehydrogenase [Acidobacteria bacterium]|nr:acyl-CoA dehydrogenase [Acidobacteriota bacterium]
MDWKLTADQSMIREMVREFADAEIAPHAAEWDRRKEFPSATFEQLGELGLFGMVVPEEWGGAGLDGTAYCLALEELGRVDASTCVAISVTNSVYCAPVNKFGTDAQKDRWLRPCASGQWLGAFCLSEPDAGSDAAGLTTRAERRGDDYVLNGSKAWITSGEVCGAMLVFAVSGEVAGKPEFSAFIVPREHDGVAIIHREEKMGLRSSCTNQVGFEDCVLSSDHLLGNEGDGLKIALDSLDGGRAGIAAQSVGIAQGAFDVAHSYLQERDAFGGPIGRFEGLRHELGRMAAEIRAGRLLYLRAATLRDRGLRNTRQAAIAKLHASEASNRIAYQAVQMHGGYGYVTDYDVERFYRDARVTTIYEGTSEIQRLVIARAVLQSATGA